MRDPHVKSLRYGLKIGKNTSFDSPPAIECETDQFLAMLDNGILTCEMKEHYASIGAAHSVVEQFLHAWEMDVALTFGRGEFVFAYEDCEIIDRDPPPPGSPQVIYVTAVATVNVESRATATSHVTCRKYPDPPKHFIVTPDVETLWHRYQGYLDGREPLLAMAYFCLTLIENTAGGRKVAASVYNVQFDVLRKLGELTSTCGDEKTARKIEPGKTLNPLSPKEINWITTVIKVLIRRVGECGSSSSLPRITIADLPPLI